jgi:hypothetical protein
MNEKATDMTIVVNSGKLGGVAVTDDTLLMA